MEFFISSVVDGYREYRDAAKGAIGDLGHTPGRMEDEPSLASPPGPQRACIDAVRACDAVVLLLGERYGDVQEGSIKSATHEEWDEARRIGKPVLAFVENVSEREEAQDRFVEEVSNWEYGSKWASYGSPDDVFREVLRALAKFIADPTLSSKGWRRLRQIDQDARRAARRAVSDGQTELRFDRTATRAEFAAVLQDSDKDLIVSGESGVGKSALVLGTTEPPSLPEDSEVLAVNLRHLPDTSVELTAALGEPLEDLLAHMDAPRRSLVIDAAEACSENKAEVFAHILAAARSSGIRIVAVTTSDGFDAVGDAMICDGAEVERHTILPLSDTEVLEAVERFPVLGRFANHPRARELLRLPIMIDLLVRASPSGAVPCEAEALQCVWQEFVCNAGRLGAGSPDASEGAMLQLAEHALRKGPPEELLAGLDYEAVASLRRSGLLRPKSPLPWERVPVFAHDLIRTYAVARWLLVDADPAAALRNVGAPRWALPAARLACEVLLSNRDTSAGDVFGHLQASFDALSHDGLGERWADVPVEALLDASEPLHQIKAAWPTLVHGNAKGAGRVLRIMRLRHQDVSIPSGAAAPIPWASYGLMSHRPNPMVLDTFVADAVVQQLLDEGSPQGLEKQAAALISDWLFSHVMRQTPAGHPTRIALVGKIVGACRERESQAQAALDQSSTVPKTSGSPQPERAPRSAATPMLRPLRQGPARVMPYQWIDQTSTGYLGLLGPDLGADADAEAILRQVAEEAPRLLQHAVDPPGCGHALTQFNPRLLVDLAEAYYIADHQERDGYSLSRRDECVREHVFVGLAVPWTSYCMGPFLAMLQADYHSGVRFINRMLNQAARHWARIRIYSGSVPRPDGSEHTHELSITGVARPYVGDAQVWAWYRNDVTAYEPCVSALRALEYASDKRIQIGAPPAEVADELLEGAESLAMVALVFGILVRHLETAAEALDPFLAEPLIWHLEASRVAHERSGMLSPDPPGVVNTDRRTWNLKQVSTMMVTYAALARVENRHQRADQLRDLGQRLLAKAMAAISEDISPDERRLQEAKARDWAEALDQDCYDFTVHGDDVAIQQRRSPELESILDQARADSDRLNRCDGLLLRHARQVGKSYVPDTTPEQLAEDIAVARDLLSATSKWTHNTLEAAAAVAASVLKTHLVHGQAMPREDLQWSADVLLSVAAAAQSREADAVPLFGPLLDMGAACSAARGLPNLLLPQASRLRHDFALASSQGFRRLVAAIGALAAHPTVVARLACARSLDRVWAAPCSSRLSVRCHHKIALKIARRSLQDCVVEHRHSERSGTRSQRRVRKAGVLARIDGERLVPHGLLAAIRALGVAATSGSCCRKAAQRDLIVLLDASRRAMAAHEFGLDSSSESCSLVAARAALQQAAAGHPSILLEHVLETMPNPQVLAGTLRAVAAAAEEQEALAEAARRHWPQIMNAVMDTAEHSGILTDDSNGRHARVELIPNPARDWPYQTRELPDEPQPWADLLAWSPQVERWMAIAPGTRDSIDQLVIAVRQLSIDDQVNTGLTWIETLVQTTRAGRGSTFTLAEWLDERRPDLATPEQEAIWHRILDAQAISGNTQVAHLVD